MTLNFNWKSGIIFGVIFTILLMLFYILFGANIDYNCRYVNFNHSDCKIYNGFNNLVKIPVNIVFSVIYPRCSGNSIPDDCIGPDLLMMLISLLVIGFIIGGFLFNKKK